MRVWSLHTYLPIHRLAAHDNSVTSLQFDDDRIVSGGSDGRVKVWDTKTGALVRELSQPAEAVWRVAFESEVAVVMASRGGRTIMEVWNFEPPAEEWDSGEPSAIKIVGRVSEEARRENRMTAEREGEVGHESQRVSVDVGREGDEEDVMVE